MQAEYGRAETDTQARSRYLKEMMHIRKVSAKDLSLMTGISRRTIERYMNGRTDTADAAGLTVAKICFVLGMNVYTLGGVDDVKPGTAFGSDGKEAVVKKYDLLSLQVDVRMMRARVIFAACRKMVLHPYFLYGFRDIKEYPAYIRAYEQKQKNDSIKKEIREEAERIARERAAKKKEQ